MWSAENRQPQPVPQGRVADAPQPLLGEPQTVAKVLRRRQVLSASSFSDLSAILQSPVVSVPETLRVRAKEVDTPLCLPAHSRPHFSRGLISHYLLALTQECCVELLNCPGHPQGCLDGSHSRAPAPSLGWKVTTAKRRATSSTEELRVTSHPPHAKSGSRPSEGLNFPARCRTASCAPPAGV